MTTKQDITLSREQITEVLGLDVFPSVLETQWGENTKQPWWKPWKKAAQNVFHTVKDEFRQRTWLQSGYSYELTGSVFLHNQQEHLMGNARPGDTYFEVDTGYGRGNLSEGSSLTLELGKIAATHPGFEPKKLETGALIHEMVQVGAISVHTKYGTLVKEPPVRIDVNALGFEAPETSEQTLDVLGVVGQIMQDVQNGKNVDFNDVKLSLSKIGLSRAAPQNDLMGMLAGRDAVLAGKTSISVGTPAI